MRALAVAAELHPLVKTGGLADVTGALPAALAQHDVEMVTLLAAYPAVKRAVGRCKVLHRYSSLLGEPARLLAANAFGTELILLDAPTLFDRPGGPYQQPDGADWPDNWLRFAALGRAAADLAQGKAGAPRFDLLHGHDWQAGLAPAYLAADGGGPPSILTIHNLAFQGRFDAGIFPALELPPAMWGVDGVEYYGGVGYLKAGLRAANAITTVSPRYAEEIRTPEFGMGLEGLLQDRAAQVTGIVNGIDVAEWNPGTDMALPARYTTRNLSTRARNRAAIERHLRIAPGEGPLYCVVSRLTWQKGMDVLAASLDALVASGGRLALLGSGDATLETAFTAAAGRHPGRIGLRLGFDEPLSHLLQGGSDAILIPSRFEPCGLTQLYGLRYGCVPVVARTGGLADTVIDANEAAVGAGVANGFQFDRVDPPTLAATFVRVATMFADRERWSSLQRQGMRADFSWVRSAARYAALYRTLVS